MPPDSDWSVKYQIGHCRALPCLGQCSSSSSSSQVLGRALRPLWPPQAFLRGTALGTCRWMKPPPACCLCATSIPPLRLISCSVHSRSALPRSPSPADQAFSTACHNELADATPHVGSTHQSLVSQARMLPPSCYREFVSWWLLDSPILPEGITAAATASRHQGYIWFHCTAKVSDWVQQQRPSLTRLRLHIIALEQSIL